VATDQHRITVDKPVYQNLGGGLVYIRTPRSFFYREDEAFSKVLAAAPSSAERVVLLDLRSNGGGAAPIQMLRRWFSQDAIAQARSVGTTYTSESCFNTALQFNAGESLAATLTPPVAAQTRSLLQGMVDAIEATPPGHCSVKWKSRETPMPPAHTFTVSNTDPKQTRVIALVDNACGSDCEGLALILSHLPETVIAGTSTAGVMGFAQPGMFVLPNSRVPFMVALTLRDNYGDRRSVSGYGVPVDVLLPTAKSQQMDSLIALARALSH
jgi:C-terminal processing protease CtpA/Prc